MPNYTLPPPAVARSSFASQKLLGELLLNGNEIGKTGATKLIQYAAYHPHTPLATTPPPATYHPTHHAPACSRPRYAHWERDRYKNEAEPPPPMKLDLSDNCVDHPAQVPPNPNPNLYSSPSQP